jgi:hypothetical protein
MLKESVHDEHWYAARNKAILKICITLANANARRKKKLSILELNKIETLQELGFTEVNCLADRVPKNNNNLYNSIETPAIDMQPPRC